MTVSESAHIGTGIMNQQVSITNSNASMAEGGIAGNNNQQVVNISNAALNNAALTRCSLQAERRQMAAGINCISARRQTHQL